MDQNLAVDENDLQEAVENLPPRQQVVIALRLAGYKQNDVRYLLGISRNTIWSDEKSAYQTLRALLGPTTEGGL